jgi:ATP synthase I subunit
METPETPTNSPDATGVLLSPAEGEGSPPSGAAEDPDETARAVLGRVRKFSAAAYVLFAVFVLISSGFAGFVALTCSAVIVMINFLWLEEIVSTILQPSPHLHARRLVLRSLARFALLGVAIAVTILVARFNALSVLLGFSIVVVGIMGEAAYSLRRGFTG